MLISLLNISSKIVEVKLGIEFNFMAIMYNFLLKTYFKGWQRLCIKTDKYNYLKMIYIIWNSIKIVFFLIMNIFVIYSNIFS